MLSAWLIGSITIPRQDFTVTQGATAEAVTVVAGTYYLRHSTGALSLIDAVATAITSHTLVTAATCTIRRNRTIVITSTESITIAWTDAAILRDLLGFDATLTPAATTFTAPNRSPLLWSPGYLATPKTISGVAGYTVPHQAISKSADGSQVYCDHYSTETWNDLSWTHIMPERMRVASGTGGGTFHEFFEQSAMLRERFLWHEEIDEDDASTSTVTYDTALGPYVLREEFDGDWYRRNVPFAEVSSPLDLPIHQVAEVS